MDSNDRREMRPYKMLLLAVLAAVVLAQVIAMAMLAQSQVQKAQERDAHERSQRMAASASADTRPVVTARRAPEVGVTNVGYMVSR